MEDELRFFTSFNMHCRDAHWGSKVPGGVMKYQNLVPCRAMGGGIMKSQNRCCAVAVAEGAEKKFALFLGGSWEKALS